MKALSIFKIFTKKNISKQAGHVKNPPSEIRQLLTN